MAGSALVAAERREASRPAKVDASAAVDLFEAIKSKDVEVKLIPKDATEARVMIANKTKKPLTVRLPEAFAGVPVLAQRAGGGNRGGGGNTSTNQSFGGGGGGMMGGMGGMGGGMFAIEPEQVAKFKVTTVCLEHGKKDPRPGIPYEMRPLEDVTAKVEVKELLIAMGKQGLSQRAAQAAAWHLANGLTWEQLANKRIVHLNGTSEMWFHPEEIQAGMRIAQTAVQQAAARQRTPKSPGETISLAEPAVAVEKAAE
jgi:hypothetical protein